MQPTRSRTLLSGMLLFNRRQQTIDCVIRELSPEAAIVSVQDPRGIPTNTVELYVKNRDEFIAGQIVDRGSSEVRIILSPSAASVPESAAAAVSLNDFFGRMQKLEADFRELAQIGRQLQARLRTASAEAEKPAIHDEDRRTA